MQVLCGVLAVLLLLFAAVQWSDPDGVFWGAAYGAGALWCGVAAFSPRTLPRARGPARAVLLLTLGCAARGVVAFWPESERWWPERSGETSRKGMGMMVVAAVAVAAQAGLRRA